MLGFMPEFYLCIAHPWARKAYADPTRVSVAGAACFCCLFREEQRRPRVLLAEVLIRASATPAADAASQSTELTAAPHAEWPKGADAVIASVTGVRAARP
jgi:hypothetical protein